MSGKELREMSKNVLVFFMFMTCTLFAYAGIQTPKVSTMEPGNGFKILKTRGDTLAQQVKVLTAKVNVAAKTPAAPAPRQPSGARAAWAIQCCSVNVLEIRSTIAALRGDAKQLQDHFSSKNETRWVKPFADVQAAAASATVILDAFAAAPDAAAAQTALNKLPAAVDAVRSKIMGGTPCCTG
jgi:hypothetical protein